MKKMIFTVLLLTFLAITANARPQYSILQTYGTKCNTCHENNQGGGLRSAPGFLSRKDLALIKPEWLGLKGFFDNMSTSSFLNDMILTGMDTRIQEAQWKVPGKTTREWMLMQATPYLAIKPAEFIEFEGQYNVAMEINDRIESKKSMVYPGQQAYSYSMYLRPASYLPQLRVGYFQPTIGQKWDDHTMLIRQVPATKGRVALIPDDYAEFGAQLDYENYDWFGVSAGVFQATNLASSGQLSKRVAVVKDGRLSYDYSEKMTIVDSNSYSTVLRATLNPTLPYGLTGYAGGSFLLNRDFYIANGFLGIGMNDSWSLCAEWMQSYKEHNRLTNGFLVDLTYQVTESVLPFVRLEKSYVRDVADPHNIIKVNQYVLGAHINLLPYIDLLPEYRIYDTESVDGYASQFAFQIHVFY